MSVPPLYNTDAKNPLDLFTIGTTPELPTVYSLIHVSGKLFFASTNNLRQRMRLWYYAIGNPETKVVIPPEVKVLVAGLTQTERVAAWRYKSVGLPLQEKVQRNAAFDKRPEAAIVKVMLARHPEQCINVLPQPGQKRLRRARLGQSPLNWLRYQLGKSNRRGRAVLTSWPADLRPLIPVGSPMVPFGEYLFRAALAAGSLSPSEGRIAELFNQWKRHHVAYKGAVPPVNVVEAMKFPVPPVGDVPLAIEHAVVPLFAGDMDPNEEDVDLRDVDIPPDDL